MFQKDHKNLKGGVLSNADIYRMNLLPRSYDERVAGAHTAGFKYPRWSSNYFPNITEKMMTKDGQ